MRKAFIHIALAYLVAVLTAYLVGVLVADWDPLLVLGVADLVGTLVIFGFSVYHDNSSVYDAYWSVIPVLIAVYWLASAVFVVGGLRQAALMALVLVWSTRLTLNWAARWRGMGHEDWRYVNMRKKHGKYYWLVSFFGIQLMPTVLVFLGCLPFIPSLTCPAEAPGVLDVIAALVTASAIWIEWRADLDVTRFQRSQGKKTALLQSGIWSLCRHPNYLGEIAFWWGLYLFGVAANGEYWWTMVGPLSITLLFLFISIPMIEKRMLERKKEYKQYQQMTPMLLPWVGVRKQSRET